MTKKDYELIAGVFHSTQLSTSDTVKHAQWREMMAVMATNLQAENSKFDRARFVNACLGVK